MERQPNSGLIGRNESDGRRVIRAIKRKGGKVIFIRCDVAREEEIRASIQQTASEGAVLQSSRSIALDYARYGN
jgi:hypothetical protein